MRALAVTDAGLEWVASLEMGEKLGVECSEHESVVSFETDDLLDLCELCYTGQSVRRVLLSAGDFSAEDVESLEEGAGEVLSGFDLDEWFGEDTEFRVSCNRIGDHDFSSQDIEREVGSAIVEAVEDKLGFTPDVDLEEPDLTFFCQIYKDSAFLGIDFAGRDLSGRDYKLYSHPASIRGNLAYALVRMSGYENGDVLLDPFCGSAPIPIEAVYHASRVPLNSQERDFAFMEFPALEGTDWEDWFRGINKRADVSGIEVHAFDRKLMHLNYGKKNAKVVGFDDFINFSKADVEWLDTEFDEGGVDRIVTQTPQDTKRADGEDVEKAYDELFYQADYVLSDEGSVVALLLNEDNFVEAAERHGFKVDEKREFSSGDLDYKALHLVKAKT